jgi:hypothetical protein
MRTPFRSSGVRFRIVAGLLGAAFAASACDSSPSQVCTGVLRLQVVATVRDSVTGAAAATGALGAMTRPGSTDSIFPGDSLVLLGALHTGVYTVTIDKPGYATWSASDVHVTPPLEPCTSPVMATLDVRLQRVAP